MNPVMAGSVKDQFQGTEASDDLCIIKESHTHGYPWVCLRIAQTHGSHMRDVVQKVSSSFYLPRPSQEGGAHQTVRDTVWHSQTCPTQFSGQIPVVYCVIPGKPAKLFVSKIRIIIALQNNVIPDFYMWLYLAFTVANGKNSHYQSWHSRSRQYVIGTGKERDDGLKGLNCSRHNEKKGAYYLDTYLKQCNNLKHYLVGNERISSKPHSI